MKIRKHFVSNSSSTSFTCDYCNEEFSGMDLSLIDVEHVGCDNGHIVCQEAIVNKESYDELIDSDQIGIYDDMPIEFCPICQMEKICVKDTIKYLYTKYDEINDNLQKEISGKFKNYQEFTDYMKKDNR